MEIKLVRIIPWIVIFLGIGVITVALGADLLGVGGKADVGLKQLLLMGLGIVVLILGIVGLGKSGQYRTKKFIERIKYLVELREEPIVPQNRIELIQLVMFFSIWFGLMAGFFEVMIVIYKIYITGGMFGFSRHFLWMAPLADMLFIVCFGLLLFWATFVFPKFGNARVIIFVTLFISIILLINGSAKLHIAAAIILAFGLSYQLSGMLGIRSVTFYRFVRHTAPWMVIILFVMMAGWLGFYL